MAATAWAFWNESKHRICNGDINLSTGPFRLALYSSATSGSINTDTVTIQSELQTEVSGGTYVAGGLSLSGITWSQGASGGQQAFDCSDPVFTASASDMSNVRFGVIVKSVNTTTSGYLLCWSALSTAQFDVTTGNTLTIQMNANGIFTLA
jgi:hypothetical protein